MKRRPCCLALDEISFRLFVVGLLAVGQLTEASSRVTLGEKAAEKSVTVSAGANVVIACQIPRERFAAAPKSEKAKITSIVWLWKPQQGTNWSRPIGTINTNVTNTTDGFIILSTIEIENASVNNSGNFACFSSSNETLLDQTLLYVGYAPDTPGNLTCTTNGLLTLMSCCWVAGRPTYIDTSYQLNYTIQYNDERQAVTTTDAQVVLDVTATFTFNYYIVVTSSNALDTPPSPELVGIYENSSGMFDENPTNGSVSCVTLNAEQHPIASVGKNVTSSTDDVVTRFCCSVDLPVEQNDYPLLPKYAIRGLASNHIGSTSSDVSEEIPFRHVQTDPPSNVVISLNGDTVAHKSTSLLVEWDEPTASSLVELMYDLRYRRTERNETWHTENTHETSVVLINLKPYTSYTVQVCARPSNKIHYISGYYSEWTEEESLMTELDAPTALFIFSSVVATSTTSRDVWEIGLEWALYRNPDEPGMVYEISYTVSGIKQSLTYNSRVTTGKFFLSGQGLIEIRGRFCNKMGCASASYESIQFIDLNSALEPVEDVNLSMSQSDVIITWSNPANIDADSECLVRLCSSPRNISSFDGIFKSRETGMFSSENINESSIVCCNDNPAIEDVVVCSAARYHTAYSGISPCRQYSAIVLRSFKIDIQEILTSSNQSSTNTLNPVLATTDNFAAQDASSRDNYRIVTRWEWSEAVCNYLHDDLLLAVVYTPLSGAECSESNSCPRKEPFHSRIGECSKAITSHEITSDVYGSTVYNLGLGYCCKSDFDSPRAFCLPASSNNDTAQTPPGAPSMPLELQWVDGSPIRVAWKSPEHPNGYLDGYIVTYGSNGSKGENETQGSVEPYSETVVTKDEVIELSELSCSTENKNIPHWVRVSAYTTISGERAVGASSNMEGTPCAAALQTGEHWNNYVSLLIGIAVCVAAVVIFLALGHYHRRRIKKAIRKSFWPPVPVPTILIPLPEDKIADDANTETYSNPIIRREGESLDDMSYHEVPDDIHDTADPQPHDVEDTRKTTIDREISGTNSQATSPGKYSTSGSEHEHSFFGFDCDDVQLLSCTKSPGPGDSVRDSGLSSFCTSDHGRTTMYNVSQQNRPLSSTPESPYDGSQHTPYSVVSPLLSVRSSDFEDYTATINAPQSMSWRALLYPNALANTTETASTGRGLRRPHSYCGSYASTATDMGPYVRYCQKKRAKSSREPRAIDSMRGRDRHEGQQATDVPAVITYTKLAIDSEGSPAFVTTSPPSPCNLDPRPTTRGQRRCAVCQCGGKDYSAFPCQCEQMKRDMLRWRGESWYDGCSGCQPGTSAEAMRYLASSPPSTSDYAGTAASYVVVPASQPPSDVNSNLCDWVCVENGLQRSPDSSRSSSTDSIDMLYPAVRGSRRKREVIKKTPCSSNPARGGDIASRENGLSLNLQANSASYVQQRDDYVTMGEALELSGGILDTPPSGGGDDFCGLSNGPLDLTELSLFHADDDETSYTDEDFSVSTAVSHLFDDSSILAPNHQVSSLSEKDDGSDASGEGYITTAEAIVNHK